MKKVLFFRRLHEFTGGHLKVHDFFQHTLASSNHTARIIFSSDSIWGECNPWSSLRKYVIEPAQGVEPDILFLEGLDWEFLEKSQRHNFKKPIINLIAGIRHADIYSQRYKFLRNRAIRICVSREVAKAIINAGPPNGPIFVIPNAININKTTKITSQNIDLLIAALKQPELGKRIKKRFEKLGRRVELLDSRLPRSEFLAKLSRSKTTLFLPLAVEGFYLPALEGMALGTIVICPDALGNREFCRPGINAFMPTFSEESIIAATIEALNMSMPQREKMLGSGQAMAAKHSQVKERRAFLRILRQASELWKSA
ncbi:MAG TPA: glycosyltransferase family 4 protein [Puia sp.]|nr:glycosyltransferase family 4 protein [Puia sp.]